MFADLIFLENPWLSKINTHPSLILKKSYGFVSLSLCHAYLHLRVPTAPIENYWELPVYLQVKSDTIK